VKSPWMGVLVCLFALGLASVAWGQAFAPADEAGKAKADAPAAAPGDNAAPVPAKTDAKMAAAAKSVKDLVAKAEQTLDLCNKEKEKPAEKQDARKIDALKMTAAKMYINAALKATGFARSLKAEDKESFINEYDKPNREKGIAILLELAQAAEKKKDFRQAMMLYKEILSIDPKNAEAEAATKRVTEEAKAWAKDPANKGGGSDKNNPKDWEKGYKSDYSGGYSNTDWAKTGRSTW